MQQYSIDIQREPLPVEVAYVGSHSTHLTQATANININALNPRCFPRAPRHGDGGKPVLQQRRSGGDRLATLSQVVATSLPTFSTINLQYND